MDAGVIHAALRDAGIRVESVSIGHAQDLSTWRVSPTSPEATAFLASLTVQSAQRLAALRQLRQTRNARLAASDWAMLEDAPSVTNKEAWKAYRQALRDLPATVTDPANPVWPTPPSA